MSKTGLYFPGGYRGNLSVTAYEAGSAVIADAVYVADCDRMARLQSGDEFPECMPHGKTCLYRRLG